MDCSYCTLPLPDDAQSISHIIMHNKKHAPFLYLHAECIREVLEGLKYSESLVVH